MRQTAGANVPVCASEERHSTRDGVGLASVRLDPDASGVLHAKEVVHNLEALVPLREVDGGDVHDALELALRVVPEEGENLDDGGRRDVDGELVLEDGELLDVFREALSDVRAISMECRSGLFVL